MCSSTRVFHSTLCSLFGCWVDVEARVFCIRMEIGTVRCLTKPRPQGLGPGSWGSFDGNGYLFRLYDPQNPFFVVLSAHGDVDPGNGNEPCATITRVGPAEASGDSSPPIRDPKTDISCKWTPGSVLFVCLHLQHRCTELRRMMANKLRYLLILDFEATCGESGFPQDRAEIIEFPTVVYDLHEKKEVERFHEYVRPVIQPQLTEFCTQLTGIIQVSFVPRLCETAHSHPTNRKRSTTPNLFHLSGIASKTF